LDEPKPKATAKASQNIEVLNPATSSLPPLDPAKYPSTSSSNAVATGLSASMPEIPAAEEEEEGIPELTPSGRAFSQINPREWTKSLEFIQRDPSVLAESTTDSLLGEAFEAGLKGDTRRAMQCCHQGLMIQYCRKLGRDGVRLFFDRMINGGPKAEQVFLTDVQETYQRILKRAAEIQADMNKNGADRETIQLVAEDPSTSIGFNIPDGPPPENLVIEGFESDDPEAGQPNIEDIRAFLQLKWDLFEAFPQDLKDAMKTESLDAVNKVLEKMDIQEAEKIVNDMQEGGMLSFR
jgi:cell division cycle protein 37